MKWIKTDHFLSNEINPSKYHLVVCHKIVRNHSLESSGTVHDDENWLILLIHIENVDTSESSNGHVNQPVCRFVSVWYHFLAHINALNWSKSNKQKTKNEFQNLSSCTIYGCCPVKQPWSRSQRKRWKNARRLWKNACRTTKTILGKF